MAQKKRRKPRKDKGGTHAYPEAAKQAARERILRVQPMEIVATVAHNIGGQTYGPGTIKVRRDVALMILENERRGREADSNFFGKRAGIIGQHGRMFPVPYDTFDATFGNPSPELYAATINGQTLSVEGGAS